MSQLPVMALEQRVPPSRKPGGQELSWQARLDKPLLNDEELERLVPESEKEGVNEDGITRKLAWLAKQGHTFHTYEEILSARKIMAPQLTRKQRDYYARERKKLIEENDRFNREASKRATRHQSANPDQGMTPQSAYNHSLVGSPTPSSPEDHAPGTPYSPPPRHPTVPPSRCGSQVPMSRAQSTAPSLASFGALGNQFDGVSWIDPFFDPLTANLDFMPESFYPADMTWMDGLESSMLADPSMYGYVQPDYQQNIPMEGHFDPSGSANLFIGYPQASQVDYPGALAPEFPSYSLNQGNQQW